MIRIIEQIAARNSSELGPPSSRIRSSSDLRSQAPKSPPFADKVCTRSPIVPEGTALSREASCKRRTSISLTGVCNFFSVVASCRETMAKVGRPWTWAGVRLAAKKQQFNDSAHTNRALLWLPMSPKGAEVRPRHSNIFRKEGRLTLC